jgi:hypothetical protein
VTLGKGRGKHSKYAPFAFTEHGVTMLSSMLRSRTAIAPECNCVGITSQVLGIAGGFGSELELASVLHRPQARQRVFDVHELRGLPIWS